MQWNLPAEQVRAILVSRPHLRGYLFNCSRELERHASDLDDGAAPKVVAVRLKVDGGRHEHHSQLGALHKSCSANRDRVHWQVGGHSTKHSCTRLLYQTR